MRVNYLEMYSGIVVLSLMYGFAQHKGYGTAQHIAALREYGPCPIHRQSFEPVHSLMLENSRR